MILGRCYTTRLFAHHSIVQVLNGVVGAGKVKRWRVEPQGNEAQVKSVRVTNPSTVTLGATLRQHASTHGNGIAQRRVLGYTEQTAVVGELDAVATRNVVEQRRLEPERFTRTEVLEHVAGQDDSHTWL